MHLWRLTVRKSVETRDEAIDYMMNMLNWRAFIKSHQNVGKAIKILLKEVTSEKN